MEIFWSKQKKRSKKRHWGWCLPSMSLLAIAQHKNKNISPPHTHTHFQILNTSKVIIMRNPKLSICLLDVIKTVIKRQEVIDIIRISIKKGKLIKTIMYIITINILKIQQKLSDYILKKLIYILLLVTLQMLEIQASFTNIYYCMSYYFCCYLKSLVTHAIVCIFLNISCYLLY